MLGGEGSQEVAGCCSATESRGARHQARVLLEDVSGRAGIEAALVIGGQHLKGIGWKKAAASTREPQHVV